MSSVAASKRIAVMAAELEALLAESLDGTAAERTAVAFDWETLVRRCAAMTHRTTTAIAEIPTDELGEPTTAAALSTLLRISTEGANRRIKEAKDLGPRVAMTGEALTPKCSASLGASVNRWFTQVVVASSRWPPRQLTAATENRRRRDATRRARP